MGATAKCWQDADTQLWHVLLRSGDGYPSDNSEPSREQELQLTTDELLATFQATAQHAKGLVIDYDSKDARPDVRPDQERQTAQSASSDSGSSAIAPEGA